MVSLRVLASFGLLLREEITRSSYVHVRLIVRHSSHATFQPRDISAPPFQPRDISVRLFSPATFQHRGRGGIFYCVCVGGASPAIVGAAIVGCGRWWGGGNFQLF